MKFVLKYHRLRGYKYSVAETFSVSLPEFGDCSVDTAWFNLSRGVLTVYCGYQWDGASGPTLDTYATLAASLVHDVLYQCIRAGHLPASTRSTADWVLYRLMRSAEGTWVQAHSTKFRRSLASAWAEVRALYYFVGVRIFGGSSAKHRKLEPQEITYTE